MSTIENLESHTPMMHQCWLKQHEGLTVQHTQRAQRPRNKGVHRHQCGIFQTADPRYLEKYLARPGAQRIKPESVSRQDIGTALWRHMLQH